MRFRAIFHAVAVILLLALISAACSSSSDETAEQLLAVEQRLTAVTAERDALQTQIDQQADRHDKTAAVKSAVRDILDNPEAYGDEEEVVDLLATYATSDAVMQDDTFNASMNMRDSWYNTLYGGAMDAEIEVLHQWISDDGSQSSGLWVWKGTNINGKDFELFGVAIDSHNEEGLITHELILYPYPDEYVTNAAFGTGTVTASDDRSAAGDSSKEVFAFAVNDLCDWINLDEMTGIVVNAYEPRGIDPISEQPDTREVRREVGDEGQPGCLWNLDGPMSMVWVMDWSETMGDIPLDEWQPPFEEHALLSDGVRWTNQPLGVTVFYVENADAAIGFSHHGPDGGAGIHDMSEEIWIANEILKRMNWV